MGQDVSAPKTAEWLCDIRLPGWPDQVDAIARRNPFALLGTILLGPIYIQPNKGIIVIQSLLAVLNIFSRRK